jgi:hypothetical protein
MCSPKKSAGIKSGKTFGEFSDVAVKRGFSGKYA